MSRDDTPTTQTTRTNWGYLPMDDISPSPVLGPFDPFLALRREVVDHPRPTPRPRHRSPRVPGRDVPSDRLRIYPGQLRGGVRTASGVVGLKNFHDLPVRLLHGSLRWNRLVVVRDLEQTPAGRLWVYRHDRPGGHGQGDQLSVNREVLVRLQGDWHVR